MLRGVLNQAQLRGPQWTREAIIARLLEEPTTIDWARAVKLSANKNPQDVTCPAGVCEAEWNADRGAALALRRGHIQVPELSDPSVRVLSSLSRKLTKCGYRVLKSTSSSPLSTPSELPEAGEDEDTLATVAADPPVAVTSTAASSKGSEAVDCSRIDEVAIPVSLWLSPPTHGSRV